MNSIRQIRLFEYVLVIDHCHVTHADTPQGKIPPVDLGVASDKSTLHSRTHLVIKGAWNGRLESLGLNMFQSSKKESVKKRKRINISMKRKLTFKIIKNINLQLFHILLAS